MRISAKDTLCMVIDVQEKLLPVIYKNDELLQTMEKLVAGLNALSVPIIVTEQYKKGLGATVSSLAKHINQEGMDKMSFSAWLEPSIKQAILDSQKKSIIIIGIESHVCVLQTAIDLLQEGYNVYLVSDCIGSRQESDRLGAISRCSTEGGIITTSEAILFELCVRAGTPEFKNLIKIVK